MTADNQQPDGPPQADEKDAAPHLDVQAARRFCLQWMRATRIRHITLVSIPTDGGPTSTRTFTPLNLKKHLPRWLETRQNAGEGIYFSVNPAAATASKKPNKGQIEYAVARHADVDPDDANFPYDEEQHRLSRLAGHLKADPAFPPTFVIHSGNGIYPLWVAAKPEPMDPFTRDRVEDENRAVEAAVGAVGTHNIDRVLRVPGTVNYPNKKKRDKGRGAAQARMLHAGTRTYTLAEFAQLGAHLRTILAGSDLVRPPPISEKEAKARDKAKAKADREADKAAKAEAKTTDRSAIALKKGATLRRTGKTFEEMCATLAADPETAAWVEEKGKLKDRRELKRIWDKAGEQNQRADHIAATVQELNAKFFVVNEGGKAIVYEPTFDTILRRKSYNRLEFAALEKFYLNKLIEVGVDQKGNPIMRTKADVWSRHPDRKEYLGGVVFDPTNHADADTLNLWQGYAVKPKGELKDWSHLYLHIHDVICKGNVEHFSYLMRWMARMFQRPAELGEVAVVLKGGEGTGKGTLAKALMHILGQHSLQIAQAKHLIGNFNSHLRDCVFLFSDEAFFAGDKAHIGVLKALITEQFLTLEGKYQNAVQAPNFLHILMASNEKWVVPASLDARRFFVLEVSEEHKRDFRYFTQIWEQMADGGFEAMLNHLLNLDISHFNVRDMPITDGLHEQKKLSLQGPEAWWVDVLYRGYVYRSRLGLEDDFGEWHEEVTTELAYASYTEFATSKRERHALSLEAFGRFMVKMGASKKRPLKGATGERMADVRNEFGGTNRKAEVVEKARPWGYLLGSLKVAREAASEAMNGLNIEWPDDEEDQSVQVNSDIFDEIPFT